MQFLATFGKIKQDVLQAIDLSKTFKQLDHEKLCLLHHTVMRQLNPDAGHLRSDNSAIFDQYGNVVYLIIADHPYISLDMIARRFAKIPKRTLAYDLQNWSRQNWWSSRERLEEWCMWL